MIYFAQLPTGAIKIGKADDVDRRLDQLAGHFQQPLTLLHTLPGDYEEERELHHRFRHLRFRGTEQFRPGPDLLAFIGRPLLASPNPDAVEKVEVGTPVRLDPALAAMAKAIATAKGMTTGDYIAEMIGPGIRKDYAVILRQFEKEGAE